MPSTKVQKETIPSIFEGIALGAWHYSALQEIAIAV